MRRVISLLVAIATLIVLSTTATPAKAYGPANSFKLTGGLANTCSEPIKFLLAYPTQSNITGYGSNQASASAPGVGTFASYQETHFYTVQSDFAGYVIPVTTAYSLPPDTVITVTLTTFNNSNYTAPNFRSIMTYNCTTGAVLSISNQSLGKAGCVNQDNRLNSICGANEQTVAVYCEKGDLVFYAIYLGKGYFAFRITAKELAAFPEKPASNILIKEAKGARLFKLSSGQYQVHRAKADGTDYWFRWNANLCHA